MHSCSCFVLFGLVWPGLVYTKRNAQWFRHDCTYWNIIEQFYRNLIACICFFFPFPSETCSHRKQKMCVFHSIEFQVASLSFRIFLSYKYSNSTYDDCLHWNDTSSYLWQIIIVHVWFYHWNGWRKCNLHVAKTCGNSTLTTLLRQNETHRTEPSVNRNNVWIFGIDEFPRNENRLNYNISAHKQLHIEVCNACKEVGTDGILLHYSFHSFFVFISAGGCSCGLVWLFVYWFSLFKY